MRFQSGNEPGGLWEGVATMRSRKAGLERDGGGGSGGYRMAGLGWQLE
jgi:hypothetical protein